MNEAQISVCGYVAKQPMTRHMADGRVKTELRVAWTPRWVDKATGEWVDGITSYATVYCWRKLAVHAAISLRKGEPVVVQGRLTVRPYEIEGVRRESVEIVASSIGHDLGRGVATFSRVKPSSGMSAAEFAAAQATASAEQAVERPDSSEGADAGGSREDDPGARGASLIDDATLERMEHELLAEDEHQAEEGEDGEARQDGEDGDDGQAEVPSGEKRAIGRARKERAALPA